MFRRAQATRRHRAGRFSGEMQANLQGAKALFRRVKRLIRNRVLERKFFRKNSRGGTESQEHPLMMPTDAGELRFRSLSPTRGGSVACATARAMQGEVMVA